MNDGDIATIGAENERIKLARWNVKMILLAESNCVIKARALLQESSSRSSGRYRQLSGALELLFSFCFIVCFWCRRQCALLCKLQPNVVSRY